MYIYILYECIHMLHMYRHSICLWLCPPQVDRTEEPAYFFLSSTWLLVTLLWFILQSCLKPSVKQIEQLVQHYEVSQPTFSSASGFPTGAVGVVVGAPITVGAPVGGTPRGAPPATETEMARAADTDIVVVGQARS